MTSTNLLSLQSAVNFLSSQQPAGSDSDQPVNVLGVVESVSVIQAPPASTAPVKADRVEMWITDSSLPEGKAVRISLMGTVAVVRVAREQIRPRDILRFNRVVLGKDHSATSYHLSHSFTNLEPGYTWFRLGKVDTYGAHQNEKQQEIQRVPQNMTTLPVQLEQIVSGYRQRDSRLESNSPLPTPALSNCQQRNLIEVQQSVGLVSNVSVQVTHWDKQAGGPRSSNRKKRGRDSTMIGFATLEDETGKMTLIDPGNGLGASLRTAMVSNQWVLISNVVSKKQDDVQGRHSHSNEVVLLPTDSTFLVSQPEKKIVARGMILPSQFEESQSQAITPHTTTQTLVLVSASIASLTVNGVDIASSTSREKGGMKDFASSMITAANDDQQYQYHSAVVHLSAYEGENAIIHQHGLVVGPHIMKDLCGGIHAHEIMSNEGQLADIGCQLIISLFRESVVLQWTALLHPSRRQAEAIAVVLPRVDTSKDHTAKQ